jgi:nucleoside-diphosphate-sugar epimerase
MDNIMITGAAGFIGSNITSYFCEKGAQVTCFIRESSCPKFLKKLPVEIFHGDITDINTLIPACKKADWVIHIAALANDWSNYDEFYKINVTGTLNVLKASYLSDVQNLIVTGSISSYGEEDSRKIKDEGFPYHSNYQYFFNKLFPSKMNYYRNTKALSTQEAIRYAKSTCLNLTILEPTWVYGEHEFKTGFYEYLKIVKAGMPFFPGSKKNKFHVIYVRDLARAYYLAYKKKLNGINRMIVGNPRSESMDRLFSLFCKELGVKKPRNLPKPIVYPLGLFLELIYTVFSFNKPPLLTRGRVNMFYDNIEYSVNEAKKKLSFISEYSLEEGVHRTVDWYKTKQLI